jgi:NADP-dependent 3-hydroxy acid dehydrogenase YdfG
MGAASSRVFAAEGARFVLGARSEGSLQAIGRQLREAGADVIEAVVDVRTRARALSDWSTPR